MKRILLLLASLVAPSWVAAQGVPFQIDPPVPNGKFYVCIYPQVGNPCSNQQPVFADIGLSIPLSQPVLLGSSGSFTFFVAAGNYVLQLYGPNGSVSSKIIYGGGGGATPGGSALDAQINANGSSFGNGAGAAANVRYDPEYFGPNPGIDIRAFYAMESNANTTPQIPGITANCTSGNATLPISSASTFQNNMYVAIYGCGATNPVSTPSAPTVTPATPISLSDIGLTVASQTGATTYQYAVRAVQNGAVTACSPFTSISTGLATLGPQSVAITSITGSGNTYTFVLSAAQTSAVGGAFIVTGADNAFNGIYRVATWTDSTHLTALRHDNNTLTGGPTSAVTPGTMNWIVENTIQATPPAGAVNQSTYYAYYGGAGSAQGLIGIGMPQWTTLSAEPGYLTFEDYGTTYGAPTNYPWYIPPDCSTGATNQILSAQITAGAGTTSLTINPAPSQTISGQTILHDDGPAIAATATAAVANKAKVIIPMPLSATNSFVINSPINVSNAQFQYYGRLLVNDTIKCNCFLDGDLSSAPALIQFTQAATPTITIGRGNPAFYSPSGSMVGFNRIAMVVNQTNNVTAVLQDGGAFPTGFTDFSVTLAGNGYTSKFLEMRGTQNGANSLAGKYIFKTFTMAASQLGNGSMNTPGIFFNTNSSSTWEGSYFSGKGVMLRVPNPGALITAKKQAYCQACYMPFFNVIDTSPLASAFLSVEGGLNDTTFWPHIANWGGVTLIAETRFGIPSNWHSIQGTGSGSTTTLATGISGVSVLSNNMMETSLIPLTVADGLLGSSPTVAGVKPLAGKLAFAPSNSVYARISTPAPVSCVVSTGGSFPIGSYNITINPVFPDNGEGDTSPSCPITTSSGNQTVTVTFPTSLTNVIGWDVYANGVRFLCPVPSYTGATAVMANGFFCGISAAQVAASGPSGFNMNKMWSPTVGTGALQTTSNCAVNSVSPAACGSAAAGAFVVPTTTTTYTVNTTAVTSHSRIIVQPISFAADLPSTPTCVAPLETTEHTISAITAATSFTLTLTSTTGQTCWYYWIVN